MTEKHPFGSFVPKNARYLILGSFTARQAVSGNEKESYDWFYTTKRNQFWPILEGVYNRKFQNKKDKQELFTRLKIAITDIILQCERKANNNLDMNLTNIVFNTNAIYKILHENKIESIFFSSRFVEKLFKKHFKGLILKYPKMRLIALPSPLPRYAALTKSEKISKYKVLLPKLNKF